MHLKLFKTRFDYFLDTLLTFFSSKDLKKSVFIMSVFLISCTQSEETKIVVAKDLYLELSKTLSLNAEVKNHFVKVTPSSEIEAELIKEELHKLSHFMGRCGGYTEDTDEEILSFSEVLDKTLEKELKFDKKPVALLRTLESKKAFEFLSIESLKASVELLSSYKTRSSKSKDPNKALLEFMSKIEDELKNYKEQFSLELIEHEKTNQGSIHVHIEGSERPEEVVVIGGHIDSTTNALFSKNAPGADDNASGSAVVYETLKAFLKSGTKPKRSLDFFWYGAEEVGLVGSKEIAKSYKDRGVDVIAVMQLDMVLFPGNGDVIGLTEDFTDAGLTLFLESIVTEHLRLPVERYKCGYGCSDHASWFRNGFKTAYPFEATAKTINKKIHTKNDVVDERLDFSHALRFAKIALSFAFEVGDTEARF